MKKLIVICLCLAVIIGIGVGVYEKTKRSRLGIEDVLPQNISFYVQLHDVEKNFKELASMPIWQGVSNIDYDALMEKNAIDGQQGTMIRLIKNQLLEILNNPLAKRLFGQDVAIASYPLDKDFELLALEMKILSPKFVEELLSGLFLVTRVDKDVQFAEFVSRFFSQFGSNVSQGQVEYKGEIIHTINVSNIGMKFGIVRLNDLLVVGVGEKAARMSVDVYKGDEKSLASDLRFTKAQNRFLKPAHMVGYFNFVQLITELKKQGDELVALTAASGDKDQIQEQWDEVLAKMAGLEVLAFSSQLTPLIRIDSRLVFDPDKLDAEYIPLYTCPPSENQTIQFIPQEVLGYYWSNCLKLNYYWEQIKKEMKRKDVPALKIDEFEATLGLNVEKDILPAFGDEIGGYVQDIQVGGLFPIPKILLFIKVGDKAKAQHLLNKLEEQPFVMLQEENYGGTLIKYLGLPMGQDIQPGYSFLGDYLLISSSRNLIKESIDTSKNALLSLQSSPAFKEIDFGLTDRNRSVQFFMVKKIIEKMIGVVEWSNQWIATKDRKAEAFKAGSAKPLEEVKISIALKESELDEIRERLILVEDEIWNIETKGLDANAKQIELNDLQNQFDSKKEEIFVENERKEELASIVGELDNSSPDPELRQFYLDEVVYPLLDSLKSIKSFGLRSTVSDNAFESSVFLKVTN